MRGVWSIHNGGSGNNLFQVLHRTKRGLTTTWTTLPGIRTHTMCTQGLPFAVQTEQLTQFIAFNPKKSHVHNTRASRSRYNGNISTTRTPAERRFIYTIEHTGGLNAKGDVGMPPTIPFREYFGLISPSGTRNKRFSIKPLHKKPSPLFEDRNTRIRQWRKSNVLIKKNYFANSQQRNNRLTEEREKKFPQILNSITTGERAAPPHKTEMLY